MTGPYGLNAADHVEQEVKPELVPATGRLTQEESKVDVLAQAMRHSPVRSGHAQVTLIISALIRFLDILASYQAQYLCIKVLCLSLLLNCKV